MDANHLPLRMRERKLNLAKRRNSKKECTISQIKVRKSTSAVAVSNLNDFDFATLQIIVAKPFLSLEKC